MGIKKKSEQGPPLCHFHLGKKKSLSFKLFLEGLADQGGKL